MSTRPERADGGEVPAEIAAARILRRWAKANGKHRKVRKRIPDEKRAAALIAQHGPDAVIRSGIWPVDARTGEVLARRVHHTAGPFVRRNAGFVTVNDGVEFAAQLHAALEQRPYRPGGSPTKAAAHVDALLERRQSRLDAYYAALDRARAA